MEYTEYLEHKNTLKNISDESIWITSTPSTTTRLLPFYIMEIGHFFSNSNYSVKREYHDSYLLIFTLKGSGCIHTNNTSYNLTSNTCTIIDCHSPHEYYSTSKLWDFFWIHFDGNSITHIINLINTSSVQFTNIDITSEFNHILSELLALTKRNDIISNFEISTHLHTLINIYIKSLYSNESEQENTNISKYIDTAVKYIHTYYPFSITIDDIIEDIGISKYHFIRCFKKKMGITPYNYLTNYRINIAKILLRTTDKSVSTIAEECGFLDTSNFIVQFKKYTNIRPTEYRYNFNK